MTIHRLRRMHNNQRGITLPELLIVVVIIGLISGGIALLISRTITGSARDSDLMILVRQVQQAGTEVHRDILQARCVGFGNESGFPLDLWLESEDPEEPDVTYDLQPTGGRHDLLRTHNGQMRRVARYIEIERTEIVRANEDGKLTFTVTASFEGQEDQGETRVYEVRPRPKQWEGCPE